MRPPLDHFDDILKGLNIPAGGGELVRQPFHSLQFAGRQVVVELTIGAVMERSRRRGKG